MQESHYVYQKTSSGLGLPVPPVEDKPGPSDLTQKDMKVDLTGEEVNEMMASMSKNVERQRSLIAAGISLVGTFVVIGGIVWMVKKIWKD